VIELNFGLILASVPDGRPFGLDSQTLIQIVANLINVGLLAAFLAYMLYRPVRNILNKRTERIQGQLAHAEEEMAKAADLKLLYEQKMEEAAREREDILSEARRLAAETSQRLVAEARKDAEAIKARASANVLMEWERAEADMRTAIIDVSAIMAEKFVTLAINKETHDRLFDETIANLEGMSWRD